MIPTGTRVRATTSEYDPEIPPGTLGTVVGEPDPVFRTKMDAYGWTRVKWDGVADNRFAAIFERQGHLMDRYEFEVIEP